MLSKEKIDRINYLAKKKKEKSLTPGEEREQQILRKEYINAMKDQVKMTLDSTKFVDPEGKEILVKHSYKHKNCNCGCGNGESKPHQHSHDSDCGCGHKH